MGLYDRRDFRKRNEWTKPQKAEETSKERRVMDTNAMSVTEAVGRLLQNQNGLKANGENYHGDEKTVKSMIDGNVEVAPRYATMARVKKAEDEIKAAEKALEEV